MSRTEVGMAGVVTGAEKEEALVFLSRLFLVGGGQLKGRAFFLCVQECLVCAHPLHGFFGQI